MVFALIFGLMAAFVAVVTVSAARARNNAAVPAGVSGATILGGSAPRTAANASLNSQLAAALGPEVSTDPGTLAVGVIDTATGRQAVYNAGIRFPTGSIVKADILATLLLQHQRNGSSVVAQGATLATDMIENSSDAAARSLWRLVGGVAGVESANHILKLTHTSLGPAGRWGLTSTTVSDQLQLLTDLTSPRSPLDSASRAYAVSLMEHVAPGQRWGIPAAASPGARYAVRNGWLPDQRLLAVDSMGVVRRNGQELLIVVLSRGNPTLAAGIARAQAAAVAAADVVMASNS
jgi:Beta-lactamase enzyme family